MTPDEVAMLTKTISYKPNWKFQWDIQWDYNGALRLVPSIQVQDVGDSSKEIILTSMVTFSSLQLSNMDKDAFLDKIFNFIMETERHEASEWFRVDGKQVYETH